MRKSGSFSNLLFCALLLAGLYGILHDQVTATISPEYFTRFKFRQFAIDPRIPFRSGVAIVGFYATWWVGLLTGILLGIAGLCFPDHKSMRRYTFRALGFVLLAALAAAFIGYAYGKTFLADQVPDWYFPPGLEDKTSFIVTGSIHNAGYTGALTGLAAAITYLIVQILRTRKRSAKAR